MVQHHFQTLSGIIKLEFGLGGEILSDCDRGVPLLVWVNSYDQVSLRDFALVSWLRYSASDGSSYFRFGVKLYTFFLL